MTKHSTKRQARWKDVYTGRRAAEYDRFIQQSAMKHADALQAVVDMSTRPGWQPSRVLELGTGTGILTKMVLRRFPHADLWGIDGSRHMLAQAQRKLTEFSNRLHLFRCPFEEIPANLANPARDGGFDLVLSSFALHHMDHAALQALFGKIKSWLAPEGRLVVADYVLSPHTALQRRYEELWVEFRMRHMSGSAGRTQDMKTAWQQHINTKEAEGDNPAVLGDILAWLRRCGFQEPECHWRHFCYAVYGASRPPLRRLRY
ncbi:MAG TPA: 16S rRNA (cytosine(1402)-N(4))-methyltransferase [Elusimicrobia bacterium]|nr:16S rRNA (cytosine(1402)-N(4))-methyltransferase [Elusimicrobiota bacterium]HBT61303.1 16S rRNA (cytosine(1402)-N(4))-methyltransferase [Elusimicrobiota bacterium]